MLSGVIVANEELKNLFGVKYIISYYVARGGREKLCFDEMFI